VLPVPHRPDLQPSAGEQASLLTLTTCHPKFSDRQRMIVYAVLVEQAAKDPAQPNLRPKAMEES
jgi:sortase (surface protein transpeptidase)